MSQRKQDRQKRTVRRLLYLVGPFLMASRLSTDYASPSEPQSVRTVSRDQPPCTPGEGLPPLIADYAGAVVSANVYISSEKPRTGQNISLY